MNADKLAEMLVDLLSDAALQDEDNIIFVSTDWKELKNVLFFFKFANSIVLEFEDGTRLQLDIIER